MVSKPRLINLRRSEEFQSLKQSGKKLHVNPWIMLSFTQNSRNELRFGWTIPKYVGNAVVRNRLRRWLREFFRRAVAGGQVGGLDVNVVIKRYDKNFFRRLPHAEFDQVVARGWQKIRRFS